MLKRLPAKKRTAENHVKSPAVPNSITKITLLNPKRLLRKVQMQGTARLVPRRVHAVRKQANAAVTPQMRLYQQILIL
jgi:hypothetical protein